MISGGKPKLLSPNGLLLFALLASKYSFACSTMRGRGRIETRTVLSSGTHSPCQPRGGVMAAWRICGRVDFMGNRKDNTWFQSKVAELKAELEKLPPERQEQFGRELEGGRISEPSECLGPSEGIPSGRAN